MFKFTIMSMRSVRSSSHIANYFKRQILRVYVSLLILYAKFVRGLPSIIFPLNNIYEMFMYAAAAAKSLQLCLTLCDPIDGSPPGSSILGILQKRILEWFAISFSNACMHAKSLQSCPTLCNPTDSSPLGSSVPGIL